ncbi:MAG TPA: hypothetical protein VI588_04460 [Candidatus Gracilibacteria bacterium]|nr:hypothetical protein [Candidatus Gracilibacteria bacterium]
MKQFLHTIGLRLIVAILTAAACAQLAMAQAGGPSGPGQQVICRNSRDWGVFISSVISFDDFSEYWKDILSRYNENICHYQDIDGLLNRIKGVQEQIRSGFYACADVSKDKKTFYEIDAEIYFLRKYVNAANGQFLVTSDQQLISDMRNNYVVDKGFFTDAEIQPLFDKFKQKYEPKLEAYKNCKDMTWQALVDKWNEFKETAGGLGPALKQASESIEKKWDKMEKTSMNLGRDFIGGFLDAKVNVLPAKEGFNIIGDALKANSPSGYTHEQLQAAKNLSDINTDYAHTEADYLIQYQTLYKETSDQFNELIGGRLIQLNSIIRNTYQYENQTIQCVASINGKQC